MTQVLITVEHPAINGGRPTNIPSLFGDKILSEHDAIFNAFMAQDEMGRPRDPQTMRVLPAFSSLKEAELAAASESESIRPLDFNRALEKKES